MVNDCCTSCDSLGLPVGPKGDSGAIVGANARILVPSASVLTLFSTPFTLLAAPGIGKAIELINWSIRIQYKTITYATATTLQILNETATTVQGNNTFALTSTASRHVKGQLVASSGTTATQLIENKKLILNTLTANPTAGNSDLIIYIGYNVITL